MKKTILITWWLWYIWSHWVVAFEQAWYKTVIVDNFWNSSIDTLDWIEKILGYKPDFWEVDLRTSSQYPQKLPHPNPLLWEEREKEKINFVDWCRVEREFCLEDIFKKYDFDWVIHFAWLKAVWESCEKPLLYFDNNLVWSIKLFELMEKYEVKNLIFSSSATVYNPELKPPFKEENLVWNTTNPYWTTKYLIEKILKDLSKFAWFNVINLRYFNPIWAHPSWLIWENPEGIPNNLLPFIMKVATWELEKLKVFWDDYDTIDWSWVRDYIDVNDLIEGHLLAWEKLTSPQPSPLRGEGVEGFFEIYNLWVWKGVSVFEMIEASKKVTWKDISFEVMDRRDWDLWEVYCDASKAREELSWEPKVSLDYSLENSWRFYNK